MSRGKINRRKFIQTASASGIALGLAGCTSTDNEGTPEGGGEEGGNGNGNGGGNGGSTRLITGWSEEGSSGFTVGNVLAKIMSQYNEDINIDVRSTGSAENLRLLSRGELNFGYTNAHLYDLAMRDQPPYKKKPLETKPLQAFGIFGAQMFYLARANSDVETISDFAGKRVSIFTPSVSMYAAAQHGLQEAGVYSKMDERQISISDIPQAFSNGRIDVTLAYNAAQTLTPSWVQDMVSRMKDDEFNFVKPTKSEAEAMTVGGVNINEAKPPSVYENQEAPTIRRLSLSYSQHCRPDVSEDDVYGFIKTIHEHRDQAAQESALLKPFGTQSTFFDPIVKEHPVHPGAVKYFKEQGWWSDEYQSG